MTSSASQLTLRIARLLEGQLEVLRELRGVMADKQDLLVKNDTEGLVPLANREEQLAQRLRRLEKQRLQLIAEGWGVSLDEAAALAWTELAHEGVPDPLLGELSGSLRREILEVQELQDDNRLLTARLVEYGNLVLRLLTQGEQQPGYNSQGQPAEGARQRELLNCRV